MLSFPRKRESSVSAPFLDARLRGHDERGDDHVFLPMHPLIKQPGSIGKFGLAWIVQFAVLHPRKRGKLVGVDLVRGQNVPDRPTSADHGIGNERTMAPPGHGFGAHNGSRGGGGQLHEGFEALPEGRRFHVIGIALKTRIPPTHIRGVLLGFPAASKYFHRLIMKPNSPQMLRKLVCVELGIPSGIRNGAYISHELDAMSLQQGDEFFDRPR